MSYLTPHVPTRMRTFQPTCVQSEGPPPVRVAPDPHERGLASAGPDIVGDHHGPQVGAEEGEAVRKQAVRLVGMCVNVRHTVGGSF